VNDDLLAAQGRSTLSLHKLGVFCGLAAAVWLGTAEAPTKLVNAGFSPFLISMGHGDGRVCGALDGSHACSRARVSLPDLRDKPHLIGGRCWRNAVGGGHTLTISRCATWAWPSLFRCGTPTAWWACSWAGCSSKNYAARDSRDGPKVLGGAFAIVGGATVLPTLRRTSPIRRAKQPPESLLRWARASCWAPCIFPIARPISAA